MIAVIEFMLLLYKIAEIVTESLVLIVIAIVAAVVFMVRRGRSSNKKNDKVSLS